MDEQRQGTIKFIRASKYPDRIRTYKIFVDETPVGTLGAASSFEITTGSGRKTIQARIDWCRSQPLYIEIQPGQRIEIDVTNDWNPMLALVAVTFAAHKYLTLTVRKAA